MDDAETRKTRIAELHAALRAERQALKSAAAQQTPLERVEARQQQHNERLGLLLERMLRGRLKASQPREAAVEAVTAICRRILEALPEQGAADETDDNGE